jgi:hypothetical protein
MSGGLTLQALMDTDVAAMEATARGWLALAEGIDETAEALIRGTRTLEDAWSDGPAAAAAVRRASALRAEVSNAQPPCRRIGQELQQHAQGVQDLQELYLLIQGNAAGQGIDIDVATGRVTASAATVAAAGRPDMVQSLVDGYVSQLGELLDRAVALDSSTKNLISVNLPDTSTGFGTSSLSPVGEQTLLDQARRTPEQVAAWWSVLTPQQQEDAIRDHPELVGWLDGVPADDRDTANRLRLDNDEAALTARRREIDARVAQLMLDGRVNSPEVARLMQEGRTIDTELDGLNRVRTKLGELEDGGKEALLLGIDPAGDGKAVVAVGNPDTARHTAVWVPGLNTELTDAAGNITRVTNIQDLASTLTDDPVAGIFWLGYDAPELSLDHPNLSVAGEERSREGGAALDRFVDGLRATHAGTPSHVTVEGHSYGSTAVAEAALNGDGLAADDIITAGSPGMHTDKASDLGIGAQHVWSGSAEDDPVSQTSNVNKWLMGIPIAGSYLSEAYDSGHGISPHEEDFGGNRFTVDTEGHSGYWEKDSLSLRNQASIVAGKYDRVSLDHGKAPAQ